jgi:hypothetical protein
VLEPKKKATRILIAIFVANCFLVATHLGEFWPFSIYPMFSRADTKVHQVLVREVESVQQFTGSFKAITVSELPGEEFGVKNAGVDPVDLNKYVRLTEHWDDERLSGLVRMFRDDLEEEQLLLFDVKGDAVEDRQENYQARPLVYFDKSGGSYVGPAEMGAR